jgi:hypothetical protein
VVRETRFVVAGVCPGREVVLRGKNQTTAWRVVVAGPRVYEIIARGPWVKADGPRTRRFLDSFAVTDDTLLAAAREQRAVDELRRRDEAARKFMDGVRRTWEQIRNLKPDPKPAAGDPEAPAPRPGR